MRAAACVIACALGACADPTLSVTVDIPQAYRAQVAEIALADYEQAGLDCDPIAYGDESAQELDGALTTEVDVAPGSSAPLTGISRVDHKVMVARGLDTAGNLVVAGCRELDELDGDVSIEIDTEAAALVTIDERTPDAPLDPSAPITLHALDPLGQPLSSREVVWRVFGPKGLPGGAGDGACTYTPVDGCTLTDAGNATVAAAPPDQPGPALVDVRVKWAQAQPGAVAAFQSPLSATFTLRTVLKAVPSPSCVAYHAASGVRVACLGLAIGGAVEVDQFAWNGSAMAKLGGAASAPNAVSLVAVPGGTADTLIAVGSDGSFVDGNTGASLGQADLGGGTAVAAQLVPACGKTPFVLVGLADGSVRTYDTGGGTLATFVSSPPSRTFALAATGCVSDLTAPSTTYRAAVMVESKANMTTVPFAQIDCPSGTCSPTWSGLGEGVGFVQGAGGSSRLASGRLALTGVVIDESELDPSRDAADQLVSVATHDSISVPSAIAAGDFDGDGNSDRAWLLVGGGLRAPGRVQIELAATADGAPIAGVSPEIGVAPVGLVAAQLDDDTTTDLVVYSADQVTIILSGKMP